MSTSKSILTTEHFESQLRSFFETIHSGGQFSLLQVKRYCGVKRLLGFLESGVYHTPWNGYPFKGALRVRSPING